MKATLKDLLLENELSQLSRLGISSSKHIEDITIKDAFKLFTIMFKRTPDNVSFFQTLAVQELSERAVIKNKQIF